MKLKPYLLSMPINQRQIFAARCGTSYGHLRNVAYGKSCAQELAIAIERESGGVVTVAELHAEFANLLKAAGYVRDEVAPTTTVAAITGYNNKE